MSWVGMCGGGSCDGAHNPELLHLLGVSFLAIGVSVTVVLLSRKRSVGGKASSSQRKPSVANNSSSKTEAKLLVGDENSLLENLEDVNKVLEEDLKQNIKEKMVELREEMQVRKLELKQTLSKAEQYKVEAIRVAQAKHEAELDEIEEKHKKETEEIYIEYRADILRIRNSFKNLKVILAASTQDQNMLETSRAELECPVCMEEMKPPRKIWQCADGHAVCELCKKKPEVTCCPACRKYFVGRSTIAEKFARAVFGEEEKITLTGYRQVAT